MSSDEVQIEEKPRGEVLFPSKPLPSIKNKIRRQEQYRLLKRKEKKESKIAKRKKKQNPEAAGPKKVPKTLENQREHDDTTISALDHEENDEVLQDIVTSEYAPYFNKEYKPKIGITFSSPPTTGTVRFVNNLRRMIPNIRFHYYGFMFSIKKLIPMFIRRRYTDLILIDQHMKRPGGMMIIHLPGGPTINFRISNVKTIQELKRDPKKILKCRPEVILNNFTTRLGNRVASILASLFHYDPQFRGRRAVTFHNQRDYIFFRHHRYEFKRDGTKVALREEGPRFTLKLQWLQAGLFDRTSGEYEWIIQGRRHQMETSRRRFFL